MSDGSDADFVACSQDRLLGRFARAFDRAATHDGLRATAIDTALNGGKIMTERGIRNEQKRGKDVRGIDAITQRSLEIEAACSLLGTRHVAVNYGRSRVVSSGR